MKEPHDDLLARAKAGDGTAFRELTGPYQRELQVFCYRMLGSAQDAEDTLQETMLAAWQGLAGFAGRASLRTWLYRIATTRCLNALRAAGRRPATGVPEITWLEPIPDTLLDDLGSPVMNPEALYEEKEAIALAFVRALQLLPPQQRAVLILRDILGFPTRDTADLLDTTDDSVASALKRARTTVGAHRGEAPPAIPRGSADERALVIEFTQAYSEGDVAGVVALLTEDVRLSMPPTPLVFEGRRVAEDGLRRLFGESRHRLVETGANGQPAFGVYTRDPHADLGHAAGLLVLDLSGARIRDITWFDNGVLRGFGLPRTLRW